MEVFLGKEIAKNTPIYSDMFKKDKFRVVRTLGSKLIVRCITCQVDFEVIKYEDNFISEKTHLGIYRLKEST